MQEESSVNEFCPENSIRRNTIEFSGHLGSDTGDKVADSPFVGDPHCREGWSNNFRNNADPNLFLSKRGACKSPRCKSCGPAWANHQWKRLAPRLSKGQWYIIRCELTNWEAMVKRIKRLGEVHRIRFRMEDHYIVVLDRELEGAVELDNPLDTLKVKLKDASFSGEKLGKLVTTSKGFAAKPVYKPKEKDSNGKPLTSEWTLFGKGIVLEKLYDALCEHPEWVSFPDVTLLKPVYYSNSFKVRFLVPETANHWWIAWGWFSDLMRSLDVKAEVTA